ncbi:class I adenylate-forming enzyme family protein [Streptomyces sp. SCSIO ZS0520]|uniref:class I adenylate-forming enzyme family protein n=1 Tax=Streptomyces sp. SCSIO ZS0520 TaxID=2892996 RepID=UPI0021DA1806|nr:class I adenylate-forming enzyme family protein [Streptomyces sp. SCSIO ZS0520]
MPVRLDHMLADACARFGSQEALDDGTRRLTFRELAQDADRLHAELTAAGHEPGRPVLVAVSNRAEDLVCHFAAWKARAAVVPVHRSSPVSAVLTTARRTGARLLLGAPSHHPPAWEEFTPLPAPAGTEPARTDSARPTAAWLRAQGGASPAALQDAAPPEELDGDQALVVFTSGSTGQPKGVVLSHAAFAGKLAAIQEVLPFSPGSRTTQVLQLNFSFAQWTALLTLAHGGSLRLLPRFDAERVREVLASSRTDRIAMVPSMLRLLARALDASPSPRELPAEQGSPGLIIAGGEPLSAGLGRRLRELLPHTRLADVYGLSETSTSDFILTPEAYDKGAGTIGSPSPQVSFRIADEEGKECPAGETGDLWIRTPYVMTGYLGDPRETREAFTDGWLRTGDLARLRPGDGLVELGGRTKQLISRGGIKISPLEIENCYASHPACTECLAVGVPDPDLGERTHLLVVRGSRPVPPRGELRAWGRERLEPYKLPDQVHTVDELPLGRTGKADRLAARQLALRLAGGTP